MTMHAPQWETGLGTLWGTSVTLFYRLNPQNLPDSLRGIPLPKCVAVLVVFVRSSGGSQLHPRSQWFDTIKLYFSFTSLANAVWRTMAHLHQVIQKTRLLPSGGSAFLQICRDWRKRVRTSSGRFSIGQAWKQHIHFSHCISLTQLWPV